MTAPRAVPHSTVPATCPACLAIGEHERHLVREMMFGSREVFPYLRCPSCGTLRIEEVPVDLGRHYPPTYHYGRLPDDVVPGGALARRLVRLAITPDITGRGRRLARLARRIAPVPRGYARWKGSLRRWGVRSFDGGVLDVGPGRAPDRLVVLRALGFTNLLGIDPFIEGDLIVSGVPVRKARIEEVAGRFDLVWFHHSLEHVPDPRATLRTATGLLAPGGRIVVRLPVMESVLWDRYGTNWWELDAPRHLYLFTPRAITGLAESLGLRLVATTGESAAKEFVGSEQYARDLAMFEPGSWFVDPERSAFDPAALVAFAADARLANAAGKAGRACFVFERAGDARRHQAGVRSGDR